MITVHTLDRVLLQRQPLGFRVRTEPDVRDLRSSHRGRPNRAFSEAVGAAVAIAADAGAQLVDETGRLSGSECRALVEAMARG